MLKYGSLEMCYLLAFFSSTLSDLKITNNTAVGYELALKFMLLKKKIVKNGNHAI